MVPKLLICLQFLAWLLIISLKGQELKIPDNSYLFKLPTDSALIVVDSLMPKTDENDIENLATLLNIKGVLMKNKGKYGQAKTLYEKSLELYEKLMDSVKIASVLNNLGYIYRVQAQYKSAIDVFTKALKIFEKFQMIREQIIVLNQIGSLYYVQNQFEKAEEYFVEAMNISLNNKNYTNLSKTYNNLGELKLNQKKYDEAYHYLKKSEELKKKLGDERTLPLVYGNLCQLYLFKDHIDSAEYYLKKTFEAALKYNDSTSIAKAKLLQNNIYLKGNSFKVSTDTLLNELRAVILNSELPISTRKSAYYQLAVIYEKKKEFSKALDALWDYLGLADSLRNLEMAKYVQQLETQYSTQKKSQQIQLLQQKNKLIQYENDRAELARNILIIIVLFCVVLLMIFAWFFYQKNKTNKLLSEKNQIIEQALQDKELLMKEIHHRVKNNLQIISSLLNLQLNTEKNTQEVLSQTRNNIFAMASIHEKLYQSSHTTVSIKEYLDNLLSYFTQTYGLDEKNIHIYSAIKDCTTHTDVAIPVGLILNEVISNTIKHAFDQNADFKSITVNSSIENGHYKITIQDNGKGFPQDIEKLQKKSLGLRLIKGLTQQIKGQVTFLNQKGGLITLEFTP